MRALLLFIGLLLTATHTAVSRADGSLFDDWVVSQLENAEGSVGEEIPRTLGSLAGLMFVAWLVTRKKNDLAKAKARVVMGIVLCALAGNNIAGVAKEQDVAKAFVREALVFQAQQQEKFERLGARFEEVTVAQYLTAEALTSPAGVAAGKAALEKFRSLLQERNLLLQTYVAESVALIESVPSAEARAAAESTAGPQRVATERLYKMLDRTQGEQAAAIGAIFDWAAANSGDFGASNGQLVFSTVKQHQEFQALVTRLQTAENAVTAAAEEAQNAEAAALEKRARVNEEAAEFLAK